MADDKAFELWLDRVVQVPLPKNKMARVRTLAKELAAGVTEGFWNAELQFNSYGAALVDLNGSPTILETESSRIVIQYFGMHKLVTVLQAAFLGGQEKRFVMPRSETLAAYFSQRWNAPVFGEFPEYSTLLSVGYLKTTFDTYGRVNGEELQASAFALLDETEPANVFISYKRSESSALALLVLARLKEIGLQPFVDMSIEPGSNWRDFLKERIDASDYVVVLIGQKTLESMVTQQEILWAAQGGKVIIPVWHNGFQYKSAEWKVLPEIDRLLSDTHTIIVKEESAGGYNAALTELMNRFGFTP
jgi:hypothetical protein